MQAIITKYLPATDTKGSRYKATTEAGSVIVPYDHSRDAEANHIAAAKALCKKMGWLPTAENRYTETVAGYLKAGQYVHTFLPYEFRKAKEAVFQTRLAMRHGHNNGNPHCRPYGKAVDRLTQDGAVWETEFEAWATTQDLGVNGISTPK